MKLLYFRIGKYGTAFRDWTIIRMYLKYKCYYISHPAYFYFKMLMRLKAHSRWKNKFYESFKVEITRILDQSDKLKWNSAKCVHRKEIQLKII